METVILRVTENVQPSLQGMFAYVNVYTTVNVGTPLMFEHNKCFQTTDGWTQQMFSIREGLKTQWTFPHGECC